MSLYDPPSDPYGNYRSCLYCDGALEKEWPCRDAEWICVNPKCEHSPYYQEEVEEPEEEAEEE